MSVEQIYDFEGIVETAAQVVLKGMDLASYTTQDDPAFQKTRPRVEIKYTHGPGQGRFATIVNGTNLAIDPTPGSGMTPEQKFYARRESAWQFGIRFDLITSVDIGAHTKYRALVRNSLAQLWLTINGTDPMTRHSVQMSKDNGSSPVMVSPQDGMMKTEMSFDGTISIQADAWGALITQ